MFELSQFRKNCEELGNTTFLTTHIPLATQICQKTTKSANCTVSRKFCGPNNCVCVTTMVKNFIYSSVEEATTGKPLVSESIEIPAQLKAFINGNKLNDNLPNRTFGLQDIPVFNKKHRKISVSPKQPEKVSFESKCSNRTNSTNMDNKNVRISTQKSMCQTNNQGCYSDLPSSKNNEVVKSNITNYDSPMQSICLDRSLVVKNDQPRDSNKIGILESENNVKNCVTIQKEVSTPKVCTCNVCKSNNATNNEIKPMVLSHSGIMKKQKIPKSICCSVGINEKSNMCLCTTMYECDLISKSQDMFPNKGKLLSEVNFEESSKEIKTDEVTFAHKNDISEFKFFECFKNEDTDRNRNQANSMDITKTVKNSTLIVDKVEKTSKENVKKDNENKCVDKTLKRNQEDTQDSSRIRMQEDKNMDLQVSNQGKDISEMYIKQLKQRTNSLSVNSSKKEVIEQKLQKISCENNTEPIEKGTNVLIVSGSKKSFYEEIVISKELSNDQLNTEDCSYTRVDKVNDLNVPDKQKQYICTNKIEQIKQRMNVKNEMNVHSSKNSSNENIINSKENKISECFLTELSSEELNADDYFTRIDNDCDYDFKVSDKGRGFCQNKIEQLKQRRNMLLAKHSKKKKNECVVKELSKEQVNTNDHSNKISTDNDWNDDSKVPDKCEKYIFTNNIEQLKKRMYALLVKRSKKAFIKNMANSKVINEKKCVVKELSRGQINDYFTRNYTDDDCDDDFNVPDKGKSYCKFSIEQLKQRMESLNLTDKRLNVNCPKYECKNRTGNSKKPVDDEHLQAEPTINKSAQEYNTDIEIVCKQSSDDNVEVSEEQPHSQNKKHNHHKKKKNLEHKTSCSVKLLSMPVSSYCQDKKSKISSVKSKPKKSSEFLGEISELERIKRYQCKVDDLYNQIWKHVNSSPKVSRHKSKMFIETGKKSIHKTHHSDKLDGGIWEKILEDDD
ncbi:uncharacterized protein MAL13P1.304-like isoform X2 [Cimex lectularius]|uniref:Uncharacterized protein n=1 Tax=Cimex lectularius TaxID=79782 RepID=A0A8I6RDK3_CIMLE|nr:uncharacterized protein MAL13P1.304-like isoform X2 [Cimex lectularius]